MSNEALLSELQQLHNRKQDVIEVVKQLETQKQKLLENISELEKRRDQISEYMASRTKDIDALESKFKGLSADVKSVEDRLKQLGAECADKAREIESHIHAAERSKKSAESMIEQAKEREAKAVAQEYKSEQSIESSKKLLSEIKSQQDAIEESRKAISAEEERQHKQGQQLIKDQAEVSKALKEAEEARVQAKVNEVALKGKLVEIDTLKNMHKEQLDIVLSKEAALDKKTEQLNALITSNNQIKQALADERRQLEIDQLRLNKMSKDKQLDKELAKLRAGK